MIALQAPTSALSAWDALGRALVGYQPPCQSNPDLWQSVDPDAVQAATQGCARCQVLTLCGLYATAAGESVGVWAGISREPPRQPATHTNEATA